VKGNEKTALWGASLLEKKIERKTTPEETWTGC